MDDLQKDTQRRIKLLKKNCWKKPQEMIFYFMTVSKDNTDSYA